VVRAYLNRLTPRGRYLLWALLALAIMGLDTRSTLVYVLFSIAAGFLLAAGIFASRGRPPVKFDGALPSRVTAQTPVNFRIRLESRRPVPDLFVTFPSPVRAVDPYVSAPCEIAATLEAPRRGRFDLAGPHVRGTDPLGLLTTTSVALPDEPLLVYPRFYSMDRFDIPLGRRYQPGGIPMSSHTGDSVEFVGTREYRQGDPVRNIHWRSWARHGEPVVKEYQEEYFCRIAIILDTYRTPEADSFEAAISVVASIADFFSRSEYVVDILAAGPDVYEVSAGRSLGYLENILDVLATLEPCDEPAFLSIGPTLFERLAQITTVVAVIQDWDPMREDFLRRVRAMGTAVRVIIVREGPTSLDWTAAADLGQISQMSPADVERMIRGAK
jgi:uncharacterized protein (DUF58 family)